MAVIKQTSPRASVAIGGVFDLGDLRAGAERALAEARAEAARIVDAARREADRMRADARRDGLAKGEAEGHAKGLAEGRTAGAAEGHAAAKAEHTKALRAIEEAFATEFARWMSTRDEAMRFAERELAGIAISIAESIVREHVAADPAVVAREAQAAVALFARATRVTIEVAPEDAPIVAEAMPDLSSALPEGAVVSIVARAGIARGGCVIRSNEGAVDARFETQFRRMREGILGADAVRADGAAQREVEAAPREAAADVATSHATETSSDGLTTDGLTADGLTTNGLAIDGPTTDGLATDDFADTDPDTPDATDDPAGGDA